MLEMLLNLKENWIQYGKIYISIPNYRRYEEPTKEGRKTKDGFNL